MTISMENDGNRERRSITQTGMRTHRANRAKDKNMKESGSWSRIKKQERKKTDLLRKRI